MVGKRKHRKKALHKEFWMEVRKSRARFISIFCIVALGVAFFSGIQAASPDMRMSGDAYYNISKLMDLKIIGTMGLTEDDVKAVQELSGVGSVEGAYSTDVICGENDSLKVLHVESLNKEVNQLTLTEGSLPEKSGECFLDSTFAESQGYEVGSKLVIRQDGDSKLLKTEEYTVTGIGKSPLYISFNRGNTTVGSGEVNGFAYVLPEEFDSEFNRRKDSDGNPYFIGHSMTIISNEDFPKPWWWRDENDFFGVWSFKKADLICTLCDVSRKEFISSNVIPDFKLKYYAKKVQRWLDEQEEPYLDENLEPMTMGPEAQ